MTTLLRSWWHIRQSDAYIRQSLGTHQTVRFVDDHAGAVLVATHKTVRCVHKTVTRPAADRRQALGTHKTVRFVVHDAGAVLVAPETHMKQSDAYIRQSLGQQHT